MVATALTAGSKTWVKVETDNPMARGQLAPRLLFNLTLTSPTDRIRSELHDVRAQVVSGDEVLGEGRLTGEPAEWHGSACELEVPTTHRLLDYVTSRLGHEPYVPVTIRWKGLLRITWSPNDSDPKLAGDPEPEVPTELRIANGQWIDQQLNIPRSEWFTRVVQSTQGEQYLYLEVAVPMGSEAERWARALSHLADAEKAFALGDDAGVFGKLRAVFEALPGATKHIFEALPDGIRDEADALTRAFVTYLHHGRHVADSGENAGMFPVGRLDADFALSTTKVLLSYGSRAIAASRSQAG